MKKFDFNINGNDYNVHIRSIEGDMAKLEVNGTPYKVQLKQEVKTSKTPILVRKDAQSKHSDQRKIETMSPAPTNKRPSSKGIKSPLPGNVLKVLVNVGDSFAEGDTLMVMESMKMENNILAEKSGVIVKINAAAGSTVLQDDILFEVE